jgi:hypothetical protein
LLTDGINLRIEAIGEVQIAKERDEQRPDKVTDTDERPAFKHAWQCYPGPAVQPCNRNEHKYARKQVIPHEIEHGEPDREDEGTNQEGAGIHRSRNREQHR